MYYSYQIHERQAIYSLILNFCRIFKQHLVDAYTCIEEHRLGYFLNNQEQLCSDHVIGLFDTLTKEDRESRVVSKRVFLPPSFGGGPRYMYNRYQDVLSICRVYGNPQYFITFMCNVKWQVTSHYMEAHGQQDTHSRVDVITRVFEIKVGVFIRFLSKIKHLIKLRHVHLILTFVIFMFLFVCKF